MISIRVSARCPTPQWGYFEGTVTRLPVPEQREQREPYKYQVKFDADGEYWYFHEIMDGMQHSVFHNFSNLRFSSNSYEPRTDRARHRERQQRPSGRREDGHAWQDDQGNWRYPGDPSKPFSGHDSSWSPSGDSQQRGEKEYEKKRKKCQKKFGVDHFGALSWDQSVGGRFLTLIDE